MNAVLVMLNNFFHDLTSAIWFVSAIIMWWLDRELNPGSKADRYLYNRIFPKLFKLAVASLGANLTFGGVRAWAYMEYEYLPAAGKGQLIALGLKHVILVGVVVVGSLIQFKLYKQYRSSRS